MTEQDSAARLMARYRAAVQPRAERLDEIWARLEAAESGSVAAEEARGRRPRRWTAGVVIAAAAAGLLTWWWNASSTNVVPQDGGAPMQAPYEGGGSPRETISSPGQPTAPGQPGLDSEDTESPPLPTIPGPAPTSARRPRPRAERPDATPTQPEVAVPPGPERSDRLEAEVRLMWKAERHLRAGEFSSALQTLSEHARSFPRGVLAVERRALRSIVLCRTGKRAQGRGEAALLRRDPAAEPYRERMDQACE